MKKADLIAKCLEDIESGRMSLDECLRQYPDLRDELRPLLEIASGISPEKISPTAEFRERARRHLVQAMLVAAEPHRRGFSWFEVVRRARPLSAPLALILVLLVVTAGGSVVYASQGSLPGDILYPVKIGTERIQLVVTTDPESKAYLRLQSAERRVGELAKESSLGREISISILDLVARELDEAVDEMHEAEPEKVMTFAGRLAETTLNQQLTLNQLLMNTSGDKQESVQRAIDTVRRGHTIASVTYRNPTFLRSEPSVTDEELETGRFTIGGTLLGIDGQTWNIGGVIIGNVTPSTQIPAVGDWVQVDGLSRRGKIYIIRVSGKKQTAETIEIQGTFNGADGNGKTWYLSGIPVTIDDGQSLPQKNQRVELYGTVRDGAVAVDKVEGESSQEPGVKLEGILAEFNPSLKTIIISTSGARVTINIAEAFLKTEGGQTLTMAQLAPFVGREVEARGVYRKDNKTYATEIRLETEDD